MPSGRQKEPKSNKKDKNKKDKRSNKLGVKNKKCNAFRKTERTKIEQKG